MAQLSTWAFTQARYGPGPHSGSGCVPQHPCWSCWVSALPTQADAIRTSEAGQAGLVGSLARGSIKDPDSFLVCSVILGDGLSASW